MGGGIFFAATFYLTAAIALASALMVVSHRNPVISALYLALCFFAVAVDYVLLQAHFLAVIQVLLYAGAVLVLFLMIIMLLDLGHEAKEQAKPTLGKALGVATTFAIAVMLVAALFSYGRAARVPGGQNPLKLAALLISMGESKDLLPVKVPANFLKSVTHEEQVGLAQETMLYIISPGGLPYLELPQELNRKITPEKIPDLYQSLAAAIAAQKSYTNISPIPKYPAYSSGDLDHLVRVAVWARLNQYAQLGTTEAVGKSLFKRWVLPFELSGLLLLSAILGVLLIARRNTEGGQA